MKHQLLDISTVDYRSKMESLITELRNRNIEDGDAVIELLLDPEKYNDYYKFNLHVLDKALNIALGYDNKKAVEILLNKGADPNTTPYFHLPIFRTNDIELLKLLIDKGANVNGLSFLDVPRIVIAMRDDNDDVVKLLINYDLDYSYLQKYFPHYYQIIASRITHKNLFNLTVTKPDLPTYVIMWICDWINPDGVKAYKQVRLIEQIKRSIEKLKH